MTINRNNCEEYFLLYIDRELGREEQLMVEDYVRLNPDLEKEFDLLKQTTAIPPVMLFEGREALLKEEKERRIFVLPWMRIAATLIILLAGGWFLLLITGKTKKHAEPIAASGQMAIQQDGNKKKAPGSSPKPANPPSSKNLHQENPSNGTNAAGRQKEHLASATKSKGNPGKKTNPAIETDLPNGYNIKPDPTDNPEKNSPEPNESLNPSTVNHQPLTEPLNPQPSTNADIQDLAQNNKSPEIKVSNPSTINHQPSTEIPSTVSHQPSTINGNSVSHQPSTDNAQSILVFSNNNKTVNGFFKRLLAKSGDEQVTADNRKRKIKISVFQFNVSK